jgi:hypothetical protein
LQVDIVNISSGEEQARQEDPTLEALENHVIAVNLLVNLQDPILKTAENLATTVDTLVNLQELQEPIVTSLAINPSQEKVRYISEPFASSFPYTVLIFYLLSGFKPVGVALISPCIHQLGHIRSG